MKGGIAGRGEKEKSERRFKKSSQPIAAQHVWLSTIVQQKQFNKPQDYPDFEKELEESEHKQGK